MEGATLKPENLECPDPWETKDLEKEDYAASSQVPGRPALHHRHRSVPKDSTPSGDEKVLSSDLQGQLAKFSLIYWSECRAVLCTICVDRDLLRELVKKRLNKRLNKLVDDNDDSDDDDGNDEDNEEELIPPSGGLFCKEDAVEHLNFDLKHHVSSEPEVLRRLLDTIPSLAQNSSEIGRPIPNLQPRNFLHPAKKRWCCPCCEFCRHDFRMVRWHWDLHHRETVQESIFSPRLVLTQYIGSFYFPVQRAPVVEETQAESSQPDDDDPLGFIHHWKDCNALICIECESQPILCKATISFHLNNCHAALNSQVLEAFKASLGKFSPLAEDPESIRLPVPYLAVNPNLRPAVDGWCCSCGYASPDKIGIKEHSCKDQAGLPEGKGELDMAMLQYVTLSERLYFPVHEDNSESDSEDETDSEADDHSSLADSIQTHRSQVDNPFKDAYTKRQRKAILASLWENPSPAKLKRLSSYPLLETMRTLANNDDPLASKVFRRCDNAFVLGLLHVQHSIIRIEEKVSRGDTSSLDHEKLSEKLLMYGYLVKAYKELLAMKQPGQLESRRFGRYMATQLHEPRYYYSPDALDLIDLRVEKPKGSYDILRKILQQKLPLRFLDQIGRDRREVDEKESNKELPSGGMARIIEQYKLYGSYISPSVDNAARILFGLIGGLFLLIPMVAMAYITSKEYLLITTVLFVLLFSVVLGLASKSSNQELVAATAAYAAVLVVFVSNNIGNV